MCKAVFVCCCTTRGSPSARMSSAHLMRLSAARMHFGLAGPHIPCYVHYLHTCTCAWCVLQAPKRLPVKKVIKIIKKIIKVCLGSSHVGRHGDSNACGRSFSTPFHDVTVDLDAVQIINKPRPVPVPLPKPLRPPMPPRPPMKPVHGDDDDDHQSPTAAPTAAPTTAVCTFAPLAITVGSHAHT